MMDKIHLNGLMFYGYHGAIKEENILGQRFIVDLELELDLSEAGKNDALDASVHYGEVYQEIKAIVEGKPYQLIEAVAEAVSTALLTRFAKIEAVTVKVTKPNPPINGIYDSVAVSIYRKRG